MKTLKDWLIEYDINPEDYEYPEGYLVQCEASSWKAPTLDINNLHCRKLALNRQLPWSVEMVTTDILTNLTPDSPPALCPYEGPDSPRAALQHIDRVLDQAIKLNVRNCIAWEEDNKVYVVSADLNPTEDQGDA